MNTRTAPVYEWDHNCQRIHETLERNFSHIGRELYELEHCGVPESLGDLLNYYKKWHYNNELFTQSQEEVVSRKKVIESLSKKGYGVSIDLAKDMTSFQMKELKWRLQGLLYTFSVPIGKVRASIYLPQAQERNRNSSYIIRELCKKLGKDPASETPAAAKPAPRLPIDLFLRMAKETPPHAHMALLNRMFLELTEESSTIMEGSIGAVNVDTPQHLKYIASRNLRELFGYLYDTIGHEIRIDLDWIRKIHFFLTRDLDHSHTWRAGEFRGEDFEDRSGLTFEFGNFQKGLEELSEFLGKVDWDIENFNRFTYSLARLYYLLIGIHPFLDSNGRTAKCLVNHLMLRRGLPPIIFHMHDEVISLPRYGGSILEMQHYFHRRIASSLEHYFFEREKLVHFGNLEKHFFGVNFDAGFYFRHLNGIFPLIEVDFKVYVLDRSHHLWQHYINQCRIAVPREDLIPSLIIYYGFTREGSPEWEHEAEQPLRVWWFRGKDANDIPYFGATCFIELGWHLASYDFLEISLACPPEDLGFLNKDLNYRYRMDRSHLMKIVGSHIAALLGDTRALNDEELAPLRAARDRLEWRSCEVIDGYRLHDPEEMALHRARALMENSDIAEILKTVFIPQLLHLIGKHHLTGREDPADGDNLLAVHHCIQAFLPATAYLVGSTFFTERPL
ncbi:MAG: Fic family protein [Candidatus Eremiobacteraeota bacterium]|nr:Fic family protein [Candidatus Eremiobacteraeota bacterium]